MKLDDISKEFKDSLIEALTKVSSVESRLLEKEKDLLAKISELESHEKFNKKESLRLQAVANGLLEKESQIRAEFSQNAEAEEKIAIEKKKIEEGYEKLKIAQNSNELERNAVCLREQDAARRETYLDMEERRMKMFEHKVNLIVNDKKIKKELESL